MILAFLALVIAGVVALNVYHRHWWSKLSPERRAEIEDEIKSGSAAWY